MCVIFGMFSNLRSDNMLSHPGDVRFLRSIDGASCLETRLEQVFSRSDNSTFFLWTAPIELITLPFFLL